MLYNFNGKNIRIPDEEIQKHMKVLGLSKDESIQLWLEDNDYLKNETVEEIAKKAKKNKINHDAYTLKDKKNAPRPRKPDEEKEMLIKMLAEALLGAGFDATIANKSKIIEFNVGNNHYKLDLIKQRPPKT